MSNTTTPTPNPAPPTTPTPNPAPPTLPPVLSETVALQEQIKQEQINKTKSPTDYSYIYKFISSICCIILCILLIWWFFRYHRRTEPVVQAETNISPPIGNAKIQVVTVPNN